MAGMATQAESHLVPSSDRSPASWGLGDGQAIPREYARAPEARDLVTLKESGFGRESGLHGLLAYVRLEDR